MLMPTDAILGAAAGPEVPSESFLLTNAIPGAAAGPLAAPEVPRNALCQTTRFWVCGHGATERRESESEGGRQNHSAYTPAHRYT